MFFRNFKVNIDINSDLNTARSNPIKVLVKNINGIDPNGDESNDEKAPNYTNFEYKTLKPRFLRIKLSKNNTRVGTSLMIILDFGGKSAFFSNFI